MSLSEMAIERQSGHIEKFHNTGWIKLNNTRRSGDAGSDRLVFLTSGHRDSQSAKGEAPVARLAGDIQSLCLVNLPSSIGSAMFSFNMS